MEFIQFMIKHFSKKLGFNNPILWLYNPLLVMLVDKLGEQLSVYHCVDELSAQPGMPIEVIVEEEKLLLKKVDLVFATSINLYKTRKEINENTYYSPNVADFEHFSKVNSEILEIPNDIANIPSPRIGFIGAINGYKLDFDLIVSVAKKNPDKSFIFIGQVGEGDPWTNISTLKEIDNIYLMGPRDYSVLPNYLKYFDVCLLPNNINEYTINMFPMKFFEYLSTGKPVVMTPLNALENYYDLCYVGRTVDEFSEAIEKALQEKDYRLKEKRINEAKKHNWESRIDKMLEIINEKIN